MCKHTIGIKQATQKRIFTRHGHAENMVTWQLLTDLHLQATTKCSAANALTNTLTRASRFEATAVC